MMQNGFDTVVLGAGLSGLTAAILAVRAGQRVALVSTGPASLVLNGGWLYADASVKSAAGDSLRPAVGLWTEFAAAAGCPFAGSLESVRYVPTLLGELHAVSCAPRFLAHSEPGDARSCAVVGVEGLTCFDPVFMADRLQESARALGLKRRYAGRWIRLDRSFGVPLTTLAVARSFDQDPALRRSLAEALRTAAAGMESILIPGLLGLQSTQARLDEFERMAGAEVREAITLPPSVPGLRVAHLLEQHLRKAGVEFFSGFPVSRLDRSGGLCAAVEVDVPGRPLRVGGGAFVLAAGHRSPALMGGGPLGTHSHATDARSRPLDEAGEPLAANLFWAPPPERTAGVSQSNALKIVAGYRAGQCAVLQGGQDAAR